MRKAALDMYPVSSKIAIQKKRIKIFGRKMATLPTPAMTPSKTKFLKRLSG
jgi:hypothetical protein